MKHFLHFGATLLAVLFISTTFGQSPKLYMGYREGTVNSDSLAVMEVVGATYTVTDHIPLSTTLPGNDVISCHGLALHPVTGDMYAVYEVSTMSDKDLRRLGVLDTITGVITDIDSLGNFTEITFNGDKMYGTSGSSDGHRFYEIDYTDASVNLLFDHEFGGGSNSVVYDYFNDKFIKYRQGGGVNAVVFIDPYTLEETSSGFTSVNDWRTAMVMKNDSIVVLCGNTNLGELNLNTGAFINTTSGLIPNPHSLAFGEYPLHIRVDGQRTFCANELNELSLNETGTLYQWYLNDAAIAGATSSTWFPSESGAYSCELDGEFSNKVNITVLATPSASFTSSPDPVDLALDPSGTASFTSTSTGATNFNWDFGTGLISFLENPSINFGSVGDFDVSLIVLDSLTGCSDTAMTTINVIETPAEAVASSNGPATFCSNDDASVLELDQTGTAYQWFLDAVSIAGATGSTWTPIASGDYYCEIDGTASTTVTIVINTPPTASFTATPTAVDLGADPSGMVEFMNTSADGSAYDWAFGDGFSTGIESPTYFYNASGDYSVIFTLTDDATGCSDTATTIISVINTSGLEEIGVEFLLYPVPTNNVLNIMFNEAGNYSSELIGLDGRIIETKELSSGIENKFDLSALASGTYLIHIFNETGETYLKVQKR